MKRAGAKPPVPVPPPLGVGSHVECCLSEAAQNAIRARDAVKARKLGVRWCFTSRAAAYMHTDEAYVVVGITPTGGLRLRGFAPQVSPRDVRPSTKPVFR